MSDTSEQTRKKIGKGIRESVWRRRARDKREAMQSSSGYFDQDYATPRTQVRHRYLWEERHEASY
ncbi:hypothetical protein ACQR1H_03080 [Bradyrhizobium sp. HKCCYLRH2015]|uniref:hypothetical protein n=1 Tax=Bradyrhizobium sp. HKCCYLRH2015 TaxID=3420742 RepID=UPI003EBB3227